MAYCCECNQKISYFVLLKTSFLNKIKYSWKVPLSLFTRDGWYVMRSTLVTCPNCFTFNLSTKTSYWLKTLWVISLALVFVSLGDYLKLTTETWVGLLFIAIIPIFVIYPVLNYFWWTYFIKFENFGVDQKL